MWRWNVKTSTTGTRATAIAREYSPASLHPVLEPEREGSIVDQVTAGGQTSSTCTGRRPNPEPSRLLLPPDSSCSICLDSSPDFSRSLTPPFVVHIA